LKGCFENIQRLTLELERKKEREKKKKETTIRAKPDIFLPLMSSWNRGDVLRVKTSS
jgi:hypothetical protein